MRNLSTPIPTPSKTLSNIESKKQVSKNETCFLLDFSDLDFRELLAMAVFLEVADLRLVVDDCDLLAFAFAHDFCRNFSASRRFAGLGGLAVVNQERVKGDF